MTSLTIVFVLATVAFILSIMNAMGKPIIWLAVLLLSLAMMLQTIPVR